MAKPKSDSSGKRIVFEGFLQGNYSIIFFRILRRGRILR